MGPEVNRAQSNLASVLVRTGLVLGREGQRDVSAARGVCEQQNTQVSKNSQRERQDLDLNSEMRDCSVHTISRSKT